MRRNGMSSNGLVSYANMSVNKTRVFETAPYYLGLLSGRRWNKRVVYHAINQLL